MAVDARALVPVGCLLCGEAPHDFRGRIVLNGVELKLAFCAADDFFWLTPRPGERFYDEMYGRFFYESPISEQFGYPTRETENTRRETKARQNWNDIDTRVQDFRKERVLEIGCATGEFLLEARNRGWKRLAGVELDPGCCAQARAAGIDIFQGRFEELPSDGERYDLIFADNVIEHVFDPGAVIQKCAELQQPGDRLIFRLPDTPPEGPRLKLVDHTGHFTRTSIAKVIQSHGYRIELLFFSGRYVGSNGTDHINNMTVIARRS